MVAIKSSAKPVVVEDSPEVKALKAKIASLEAEAAVKAAKPSKKAREESIFTAEDVLGMTIEDWTSLKDEFYVRNTDGSPKLIIGKSGGERVQMKAGLDYGVYRFIKGIARQMKSRDFEEFSEKQVQALRNILSYCLSKDLVEDPTPAETPVKKSRSKK